MEEKIPLIVVCGPTASGKTAVAVRLAQMYDGEVVSADSIQGACHIHCQAHGGGDDGHSPSYDRFP